MEVEIREARGADAAEMILYNKNVGSETDFLSFDGNTFNISEKKEAGFLERFRSSKRDLMLVALDGEKIVANASIEGDRRARYSHRAELSITVLKEYWGKGVGSMLMQKLIEFSKEASYRSIYLDVRADNDRAISLYRKFGFEKMGVYRDYFMVNGSCYDAQIMILYL